MSSVPVGGVLGPLVADMLVGAGVPDAVRAAADGRALLAAGLARGGSGVALDVHPASDATRATLTTR
ncbi:MAG: hypothetical protein ACLQBX_06710 [Candidatus Limnocylindrales bacterium]